MVKKKINVIDLDQTLIPYDSYSEYLNRLLLHPRYFISGIVLILLRKLRIISLSTQKKYSVIFNQRIVSYQKYVKNYAEKLFNHVNNNVMKMVNNNSDRNTIKILCTASPEDYASLLASKLGWECVASHFSENGQFIHVHGKNKIKLINKLYPKNKYDYNFAISDSTSDLDLLLSFKKHQLL